MIGKTISHYRILSKLGEGGMGVVYGAEDTSLGRQVALKVLSPQLISDSKARKRFLREAKAAAALDHPGICTVYEAGEAEGQLFIAMALLEGQTLRDRIAAGSLTIDESLDIAAQVAGALKEAHGKGVIHRDIKPGNIMLLSSGQAKVMDFGLARLEGATQLTRTGTTLGTAAYMSPEQVRGEVADARSDIWSLGVVLYEMVTGVMPFRGEYEPAVEYGIVHDEPEALGSLRREATPELEALVGKCLNKSPGDRYQSADELLLDLQPLRSGAAQASPKALAKSATRPQARPISTTKPTTLQGSSATAVQILGDRYRIERLLGRGGMGEVWLAFDLKLGVEVALKFLLPEVSSDPQRIALLRREVRTARNVASPHVCRVFDLIEIEGQELVSMEYVDGTTLQELLATQSPLDIVEARRIATQLLTGLQDIHNAGLIHRDLKPANVMITRSGRAVVMDFGLAKGVADTQTVAVAGTPAYMSPEQMRGEELDQRADLYAVGMILAEMIALEGVRDPALRRRLWDGLRQDPPKAPPGRWEATIRRAVAANRGERFASAAEMARALGDGGQRLSGIEELSPYPGLSAFTGDQAKFFFGRELDVESMWRSMNRFSLAALIGPSGVGKSSFLRAGVMAARPEGWSVVMCTPGNAPFTSLARSLLPEFMGQTDVMQELVGLQDVERSLPLLSKWRQRNRQALLIVDQFEELFTLNPPEVQSRFAELLGRLSVEADIHVLVSMRDDFFFLCHQCPALRPLFKAAVPLGPLSAQDLRRAIVEPARLCGFAFEDDALVDEMMAEVEGERGALPLVAFAAARLWELRDREHGIIARRSYEEIGKVGGALAQHAETTLERIGHDREEIVREIFRNLVTAQHTRVVRERDELLSVFDDRAAAEDVLKSLIDARLLTSFEIAESREGSGERHRIEVVHESLLTSWPRLVRWQTQDTEGAQLRDQIRQAAQLWREKSESDDLLWTGTAYKEFELWRERYPGGLTETEEAFSKAMVARAGQQRRRRRIALGAAFAVLIGVIAVIGWSLHGEKRARLSSEASRLITLGKNELEEEPSKALAYSIAAIELEDNPVNRFFALQALSRGPEVNILPLPVNLQASSFDFSPDGRLLAVGGTGGVIVLSRDGAAPVIIEHYFTGRSRAPVFAPDGDRVVYPYGNDETQIRVYSLAASKDVRTFKMEGLTWLYEIDNKLFLLTVLEPTAAGAMRVAVRKWGFDESDPLLIGHWDLTGVSTLRTPEYLDPRGRWVAFTIDRGVYVCPVESLAPGRGRLIGEHQSDVAFVAFDPAGERLVSADVGGEIRIWSLTGNSRTPLRTIAAKPPVKKLCFNPSGTTLAAVCTPEKLVHLWDLDGPRDAAPVVLRHGGGGNRYFSPIAFDPSGQWVILGRMDEIAFWPLAPARMYAIKGSFGSFTPGGQSVLAVSVSGKDLRIMDLHGEPTRHLWTAPEPIFDMAVDPLGQYAAVGTNGKGVFLVSMANGDARQLPDELRDSAVLSLRFSSDGRLLAGLCIEVGKNEQILVWDLEADAVRVLDSLEANPNGAIIFSEDERIYSADTKGNIKRWNLKGGRSSVVASSDLPVVSGFAVSRDTRFLLAGFASAPLASQASARTDLVLFDLQNGASRSITTHGNKVSDVALDPAGTFLATADLDGVIRVGPITGEEPHLLFGASQAERIDVSPDGRWIESEARDTSFSLWRVPEARPIQLLPHGDFLDYLRGQTNMRVVPDKASNTGYRVDTAPFPGWEKVPPK